MGVTEARCPFAALPPPPPPAAVPTVQHWPNYHQTVLKVPCFLGRRKWVGRGHPRPTGMSTWAQNQGERTDIKWCGQLLLPPPVCPAPAPYLPNLVHLCCWYPSLTCSEVRAGTSAPQSSSCSCAAPAEATARSRVRSSPGAQSPALVEGRMHMLEAAQGGDVLHCRESATAGAGMAGCFWPRWPIACANRDVARSSSSNWGRKKWMAQPCTAPLLGPAYALKVGQSAQGQQAGRQGRAGRARSSPLSVMEGQSEYHFSRHCTLERLPTLRLTADQSMPSSSCGAQRARGAGRGRQAQVLSSSWYH